MTVYIGVHKNVVLPKSSWLHPIGLGGYKDDAVLLSDSDGDNNISNLNRTHCELTGIYWLYKNCNDPYIGFCHYRRFFTFVPFKARGECYPAFLNTNFDRNVIQHLESDNQNLKMQLLLETYDAILPRPIIHPETVEKAFVTAHGPEFWQEFLIACTHELGTVDKYFACETRFYYGNMFVMRNKIFKDYADSLFRVIGKSYQAIGVPSEVPGARYQPYRYPGYLAERFLGLYLHKTGLRYAETPAIWIL